MNRVNETPPFTKAWCDHCDEVVNLIFEYVRPESPDYGAYCPLCRNSVHPQQLLVNIAEDELDQLHKGGA